LFSRSSAYSYGLPETAPGDGIPDRAVLDALQADGSAPDGAISPCSPVPVATKKDLLSAISKLTWTQYSPTSAGAVPLSRPLTIAGTITVSSGELTVPAKCTPGIVCLQKVLFAPGLSAWSLPASVKPGAKSTEVPVSAYESITLTSATVRLRAVIENIHPFTHNYAPIIRLEPDCLKTCPSGAQRCSADSLCYQENKYCRLCLALSHKHCACRKFSKIAKDGESCSYLGKTLSALCHGKCKAGLCVYQGKPSVYCP